MMTLEQRIRPLEQSHEYSEFAELWSRFQEDEQLQSIDGNRLLQLGRGMRRQLRRIANEQFTALILRPGVITTRDVQAGESIRAELDELVRARMPALAEYGDWAERLLRPNTYSDVGAQ